MKLYGDYTKGDWLNALGAAEAETDEKIRDVALYLTANCDK
ncbi:hypothetical protein [Bacillus mesophilum]|nr:hypothetical protein [Bacillus mesophilum]